LISSAALGARSAVAQANAKVPALYPESGIAASNVKQGQICSCYFFATVGAIAQGKPTAVSSAIQDLGGGAYKVTFLNGKSENVSEDDAMYARRNGFDRSNSFWVALFLRAYAQSTLRDTLLAAINANQQLSPFVKATAKLYMVNNDLILLAYDRAIREQVSQNGKFDAAKFQATLTAQMTLIGLPKPTQAQVIGYLNDKDFFNILSKAIESNGELFGAYRAVGGGGIPRSVFAAFLGESDAIYVDDAHADAVRSMLVNLHGGGVGAVASTRASIPEDMLSRISSDPEHPNWWVAGHAYTLLDFDPDTNVVSLRNPWGMQPAPDGNFSIPFGDFMTAYGQITVTKP
jgi:hypothetical protein